MKAPRGRVLKPLALPALLSVVFSLILSLTACAPMRDPWGLALRRGEPLAQPSPPDSLQADLAVTSREPGVPPFSARVYALPHRAYRLDATGFASMTVASYLWKAGAWTWVRHDLRQVRTGQGDEIELEGTSMRLPDVHGLLGFLWGQTLPGFAQRDSLLPAGPQGEIRWISRGVTWEATLDPSTGLCREAHSDQWSIRYRRYQRFERPGRREAVFVPQETEVFSDEESVLLLRVKDRTEMPFWRKNPFVLTPPAAYERL